MTNLGFVGLGIMGKPMAGHLAAAGHTVHVFNRTPKTAQELGTKNFVVCKSSREVAEKSDVVFTMVSDTPDVEKVIFGPEGLFDGLKHSSVVIDMSTISPVATKDFAKRLSARKVHMLDAPVSGGQAGAEQATLSIMVGGEAPVFERVKPYFDLMGKNVIYIGTNGAGQTCKLANQILVAATLEGVSEALVFASKAGVDPSKVRQALLGGAAQSRILDVHGKRMIDRNFVPGFKISLQQKDLNLVLQTARSMGVSVPSTAIAQEFYNSLAGQGCGDLDNSALVQVLEKLAGKIVEE